MDWFVDLVWLLLIPVLGVGGITLIFQQRHRCFKERVDLLLETDMREMLFLSFGIRRLGL